MLSPWLPTNHLLTIKPNSTLPYLTETAALDRIEDSLFLTPWSLGYFLLPVFFLVFLVPPFLPLPIANRVGGPWYPLSLSRHRLCRSPPSPWFQWSSECWYLPPLNLCAKYSEFQISLVNAFDLSVLQATGTQIHNFRIKVTHSGLLPLWMELTYTGHSPGCPRWC